MTATVLIVHLSEREARALSRASALTLAIAEVAADESTSGHPLRTALVKLEGELLREGCEP